MDEKNIPSDFEIALWIVEDSGFTLELREILAKEQNIARAVQAMRRAFNLSGISERLLKEGECVAYVTYQLPEWGDLNQQFEGAVSDLFRGDRRWQRHLSRVGIEDRLGDRIFCVKAFSQAVVSSEEAIREMGVLGYLPATHLEACAFAKRFPQQQCSHAIIALGSYIQVKERFMVAMLSMDMGRRRSFIVNILEKWDMTWGKETHFLFVRDPLQKLVPP